MNSRRMNRLEELGRVDAEKAKTKMGKRNLRQEKSRIVRELKADGGKVKKRKKAGPKAGRPSPQRKMGRGAQGFAKGGMVTVSGRGQGKVIPGRNKKTYIC